MRSETFTTPGALRLDLDVPSGDIEIETVDGTETHVVLEALSNDDWVQEAVATARIELSKRGDADEVSVHVPTRHGFFISFSREPDIRLRVTCPHGADLKIRTKSGDLDATGTYGAVEAKSASGDVHVQETTGDARVKTASGDIRLETVGGGLDANSASGDLVVDSVAGDATVAVVSGDIYIRESAGSVNANSVSGDQRLDVVSSGRMDLKTVSGDITVGVRRGSRLFVDANTVSGSTSSDLELGDEPASNGDAPLVELFAKAISGDVRVERA